MRKIDGLVRVADEKWPSLANCSSICSRRPSTSRAVNRAPATEPTSNLRVVTPLWLSMFRSMLWVLTACHLWSIVIACSQLAHSGGGCGHVRRVLTDRGHTRQ